MQVDNNHDIGILMPVYDLIKYNENYSRKIWNFISILSISTSFKSCCNTVIDFGANNATTDAFKIKQKLTGKTSHNGTKDVEVMVPLKYLSNFWRTLEIPLVNFEINLGLNWFKKCVIVASNVNQATTFQ